MDDPSATAAGQNTAVDREGVAGDPGGIAGREESDGSGHVFWFADSSQRIQRREASAPPSRPAQTRVLIVPGATAFTRMPSWARLAARSLVNDVSPAFAAEYGSLPNAVKALIELTVTMAGFMVLRRR